MPVIDRSAQERILEKLRLSAVPAPTLDGLRTLYAAWCQHVSFDNIRKLIHLRRGDPGPLPGMDAADFFDAWLRHGTGGTCWAGHTAWHALLASLGFQLERGVGTMLVAPDIPPNHATVVVRIGGERHLVDASMLHGEPLALSNADSGVAHAAWGVRSRRTPAGQPLIRWRPLHMPDGLDCRFDQFDVPAEVFTDSHEKTRAWSPFNYSLYVRTNRGDRVIGVAMGKWTEFDHRGSVSQRELDSRERVRVLVEELGISEEMAMAVPADVPMPPPPRP